MELDLQFFGGRGGGSGVATAGSSMQDTYGQMATAKETQSKVIVAGKLRSDMSLGDLAHTLAQEGTKPDAMRELKTEARSFIRDVVRDQKRIDGITDPRERAEAVRDHGFNYGDTTIEVYNRQGEYAQFHIGNSEEENRTVRSWLHKGNVAYIAVGDADDHRDSLGLSVSGVRPSDPTTQHYSPTQIARLQIMRDVTWGQATDDYDNTIAQYFGKKK